jgi:hypothetical protein
VAPSLVHGHVENDEDDEDDGEPDDEVGKQHAHQHHLPARKVTEFNCML